MSSKYFVFNGKIIVKGKKYKKDVTVYIPQGQFKIAVMKVINSK